MTAWDAAVFKLGHQSRRPTVVHLAWNDNRVGVEDSTKLVDTPFEATA